MRKERDQLAVQKRKQSCWKKMTMRKTQLETNLNDSVQGVYQSWATLICMQLNGS